MNIFWHGQSCFQISISQAKNNHLNIVIDPFSEDIGLRLPKLEADILLVSHPHYDHNNVKAVSAPTSGHPPFLIEGPGEYEIKGVFIQGIPSWHDNSQGRERGENTIYSIETEDLKLCHLGDLGQKELTEEQLEKIGEVDILMIPIGGVYTISAKEALKIMSQLEPKIIIPMHYQIPKLNIKLDDLDKFLKILGIKKIEPLNKLSIKKKDISPEEVKIIVLKP
jgi:L-ascorbate metabolism protein UlaG (beta-lactamase superfamily)